MSSLFIALLMCALSSSLKVNIINRSHNSNRLTLYCFDGSGGTRIDNALFYRNGLQNTSDTECFKHASPTNNTNELTFDITPDCDGYFSCARDNNGLITLSKPISIYAYSIRTGNDGRTIDAIEGENITIPCDFVMSPINHYRTIWFKGSGSNAMEIKSFSGSHIQDLIISNLSRIDSNYPYNCQIQADKPDGSSIEHGPTITLTVKEKYERPVITNDLSFTKNGSLYNFKVEISGTLPILHEWLLNGTTVSLADSKVLTINMRHLVVNISTCGQLKVTYKASSVGYDGMNYTAMQKLSTDVHTADSNSIFRDLSHTKDGDLYVFSVNTTDTNYHYSWYINGTSVDSLSYVVVHVQEMKLLVLEINENGPFKVTYRIDFDCNGFTHLIDYYFTINDESTIEHVSIPLSVIVVLSIGLNIILTCAVAIILMVYTSEKKKHIPTCERPQFQHQNISTMSDHSKGVLLLKLFKQTRCRGEVAIYDDKSDTVVQISRSTSELTSRSTSNSTISNNYDNPVANILAGVAHMMGYIEYTDISILTSLNQIITRLFELPMNDERLHQVLTETSKNLVDTIKEMKRMVSTSASVVSSLEAHETVVIDNSNNVSTDDHEDTECSE
jgi:hypothetical protein